jgi:anti-sigma-K factor RskA
MSEDDEDRDGLAAEYVLGTLDPLERAYVERQAARDAGFAAMIADWQDRLQPLTLLAPAVAPPPDLWRRIDRATTAPAPARRPIWRTLGFWRLSTAGGFALAAVLAVFLVLHPPVSTQAIAALTPVAGGAPVFLAEAASDGTLRLQPVGPVSVAPGRDLELWSLPQGATRTISLGVLPATGRRGRPAVMVAPSSQLLVSLEPQGGSPTGQPTGPVLYGGVLTRVE